MIIINDGWYGKGQMKIPKSLVLNWMSYPVASILDQVDRDWSRHAVTRLALPGFGPHRHVLGVQSHEAGNVQ